jgi:hypothetical protein
MPLVKFEAINTPEMTSVLTTESAENMGLKQGDTVELIIKSISRAARQGAAAARKTAPHASFSIRAYPALIVVETAPPVFQAIIGSSA